MRLFFCLLFFVFTSSLAFAQAIEVTPAGNVGIGTSSPSSKLEIKGTRSSGANENLLILSDSVTGLQAPGFGVKIQGQSNGGNSVSAIGLEQGGTGTNNESQLSFYTQSVAGGLTKRMIIDYIGNVGIGTANPAAIGTYTILDVQGKDTVNGGLIQLKTSDSSVKGQVFSDMGGVSIGAATNHSLRLFTNNVERMRLDNVGNVGIGTSSPGAKLDLRGDDGVATCLLNLQHTTVGAGSSSFVFFSGNLGNAVNGDALWANNTGNLFISPNASGKKLHLNGGIWTSTGVVIDGSNNVGFGTTAPAEKLEVIGNAKVSGNILGGVNATTLGGTFRSGLDISGNNTLFLSDDSSIAAGVGGGLSFGGKYLGSNKGIFAKIIGVKDNATDGDSAGNLRLFTSVAGGSSFERLRISSSGNVGIGTTNPLEKFVVKNTNNTEVGLNPDLGQLYAYDRVASLYKDLRVDGLSFTVNAGSTPTLALKVASTGYVGIGIANPTAPLHLKSAGDTVLRIEGPAASMSRIITSDGVDAGYLDYDHTTDAWILRCNGTEYFRVASTGAVFAGSVQATSFKVGSTTLSVPDYVFEKGYKLKTLEEVESAILKDGHLPGIPSAKEINTNGLDLPEMQLKLLEKVEELTLYAINQNKEIEKLKNENEKLKEKDAMINALLKRVEKLEGNK